jgi:hypothetical protein
MITADLEYTLITGSKVLYNALDCFVVPQVLADDEIVRVELRVIGGTGTTTSEIMGTHVLEFTWAVLNALTPSGADDVQKFYNLCEQAVVDHLEGLAENASVTFAIV